MLKKNKSLLLSADFRRRLEKLYFATQRFSTSQHRGHHFSRWSGQGVEFREHRPYSPGDDIRHLDWSAHARSGQLILKEYQAHSNSTLILVPDCSPTMDFGEPDKFFYAQKFLAALGFIGLQAADRVRLFPLSPAYKQSQSFLGASAIIPFLEALERLAPSSQKQGKTHSWFEGLRAKEGETKVIMISDLQKPELFLKTIQKLRRHSFDVLLFHVFAPQELNPPLEGKTLLQFLMPHRRSQLKLDINLELLQKYRKELHRSKLAIAQTCKRLRVQYFEVNTLTPVEDYILELAAKGFLKSNNL